MENKIKLLKKKVAETEDEPKIIALNDLAFSLHTTDPLQTEKYAKQALSLAIKLDIPSKIARSNNNIAISYHVRKQFNVALKYYHKALDAFKKAGDESKIASLQHNIGSIYEKKGDYDIALKYFFDALGIFENKDNKKNLQATYNNIGNIYRYQNNYELSLEYDSKSLKINKEISDKRGMSISYSNMAMSYHKLDRNKLAIENSLLAIEIKKELGNKNSLAISYANFGSFYADANDYTNAIKYQQKALELFKEVDNKEGRIRTKTSLGIIYTNTKEYELAKYYLSKSATLAKQLEIKGLQAETLLANYHLNDAQHRYKQALEYHKQYSDLEKVIYNEKKSEQIAEMQIRYESEKKNKEAEISKLKNIELAEINNRLKATIVELETTKISLQEEKEKYRSLFDDSSSIMLLINPVNNKIVEANKSASLFYGYTYRQLTKMKIGDINILNQEEISYDMDSVKNDQKVHFIFQHKLANGQIKHVEVYSNKYVYNGKTLLHSIIHDISKRVLAEKKVAQSRKRLKMLNSILRHDIANDFTVIRSALKKFQYTAKPEMLEEIAKKVTRGLHTIALQYDQEKQIDSEANLIKYEVANIVAEVAKNISNIKISVTGSCFIFADENIYSVFENIITNAIIHGKASKMEIIILAREKTCEISFCDDGKGIPDAVKSKIFDKEFCYGKTGNTGMGLYIVKQTIQEYEGTISVEDNHPKGTIFTIQLKLVQEE